MFRIAICDDESSFAEELKELISGYMLERGRVVEIDTYRCGEALVEMGIEVLKYTAVFLDINAKRPDDIKTAEKIRKVSREIFIVFVASCVDYSLEGYRLGVVRYLLKNSTDFGSTVHECMDAIIDKLNYSARKRKFEFMEGTKEIALERLLYIESRLHKLEFHVLEDAMKIYAMYETLNTLEKQLAGHGFIRIHQSYLVNIKHIKNVIRHKVILTNGAELTIARARYIYVKEQFAAYVGKT